MPAVLTKAALQRLRSLREKKHREALGLFVVEGEKVVRELLAANFPFVELYATDQWSPSVPAVSISAAAAPRSRPTTADAPHLQPTLITAAEMARISHFPTPSSILGVGRISRATLAPGDLDRGFTLALDGVQDAGNVGTLLRIADWFAFDRVLLSPDCADLFHQKVINASMGSFCRVATYAGNLPALLANVSPATPILGCDLEGDDVHALPALQNAVVVIGSEGRGLSSEVSARLTRRVTIPRYGQAESLNAGIAAAIVCDNLRRLGRSH